MSEITKKEAKKSIGVLLVAVNHPYYGNYAFQLALSILNTSPKMKITLAHNGAGINHLSEDQLSIFDKVIKVKDSILEVNGRKQTMIFKAFLNDITPYDETLYLDADMLWSPKKSVEEFLLTIPKKVNFTMQNRGKLDLATEKQLDSTFNIWVNTKHLKEVYKFKEGHLYNLSSELIFWRKCKEVDAYFKQVKIEFSSIKVKHIDFGGGIPDELPFGIAMIKTKMYPHKENWRPAYWEGYDKKRLLLRPKELYLEYFAISFGGNLQENMIKKFYNNLAQYYCNQFGEQHSFPLHDKRRFIAERHTI